MEASVERSSLFGHAVGRIAAIQTCKTTRRQLENRKHVVECRLARHSWTSLAQAFLSERLSDLGNGAPRREDVTVPYVALKLSVAPKCPAVRLCHEFSWHAAKRSSAAQLP